MAFDPDQYLAERAPKPSGGFDPDAYLAKATQAEPTLAARAPASMGVVLDRSLGVVPEPVEKKGMEKFKDYIDTPLLPAFNKDLHEAVLGNHPVAGAITEVAEGTIQGQTTPKNLAILALTGGLGKAAQIGVPGANMALQHAIAYFAGRGALEGSEQAGKALATSLDPNATAAEVAREWALVVPPAAMAALGAKGLKDTMAPRTPISGELAEPINVTPPKPRQLPAPAPTDLPAVQAPTVPAPKGPSLVTQVDSVTGIQNQGESNAAINATIVAPKQAPAPTPAPAPVPEVAEVQPTPIEVAQLKTRAQREAALKAQDPEKFDYLQEQRMINGPDQLTTTEYHQAIKDALKGLIKPAEVVPEPVAPKTPAKVETPPEAKELAPIDRLESVAKLDPSEFMEYARKVPGGYTTEAVRLGEAVAADPKAVARLGKTLELVRAQSRAAMEDMKAGRIDLDTASSIGNQEQYLSEAHQSATKTGAFTAEAKAALPVAQVAQAKPFIMPKSLAGAKPRYNYGQNAFFPKFESDLDKALYIVSQKNPSKADSQYLKLVTDHLGVSPAEARALGSKVRERIKTLAEASIASGSINDGSLKIPAITNAVAKPAATQPQVPQVASGGAIPPPPKKPNSVAQATPPDPEDVARQTDAIKRTVARALESPSVDIQHKKDLSARLLKATGGNLDSINSFTLDQLDKLHEDLSAIENAGREAVKEREAQFAVQRDRIESDIQSHKGRKDEDLIPDQALGKRETTKESVERQIVNKLKVARNVLSNGFGETMVADVVADRMDGDVRGAGPITKYFIGIPDYNYNVVEAGLRNQFKDDLFGLIKDHKIDAKSMEKINIYALARRDGGLQHLYDSGISPARIKEVNAAMTPEELAFYKQTRSILDNKVYPLVKEFMHKNFNVDVPKDENYWPLQRDWTAHEAVRAPDEPNPQKPEIKGFTGLEGWTGKLAADFIPTRSTAPKKGFTIRRKEGAGGGVNVKENLLDQHLNAVSHLLAHARDLKMLGQIARKEWFRDKYGKNYQDWILNRLDTLARDANPIGSTRIAVLDTLANNTAVAILGLRLLSQMKHASNFILAAREINPDILALSSKEIWGDRGSTFIKRVAPEIYQRSGGEESIAEMTSGKSWAKFQGNFFLLERGLDQAIARVAFLGKYMEGLRDRGIDPRTYADIPLHREAYQEALLTARRATTSPLRKDAPHAISRGSLTGKNMTMKRLIFQFQQTMMRIGTNAKHEIVDQGIGKGDYKRAAASLATYLAVLTATASIAVANKELMGWLKHKIFGGPAAKVEEHGIPAHVVNEVALEGIRLVPGASQAVSMVDRGETGVPTYQQLLNTLRSAGQLAKNQNQYGQKLKGTPRKKAIADVVTGAASLSGIPGATTAGELYKGSLHPEVKWKD